MADHHHVSKYKGKNIKYKVEGPRGKNQDSNKGIRNFGVPYFMCVSPCHLDRSPDKNRDEVERSQIAGI